MDKELKEALNSIKNLIELLGDDEQLNEKKDITVILLTVVTGYFSKTTEQERLSIMIQETYCSGL